jgi:hypothetical protein
MLVLFVNTGTTAITHMLALLTGTTARIGSLAACLLEPVLGSMDFEEAASSGAPVSAGDSADAVLKDAGEASMDAAALLVEAGSLDAVDLDSPDEAASRMAVASRAARLAVGPMAAVGSMAVADFTAVAAAMAAATGN